MKLKYSVIRIKYKIIHNTCNITNNYSQMKITIDCRDVPSDTEKLQGKYPDRESHKS